MHPLNTDNNSPFTTSLCIMMNSTQSNRYGIPAAWGDMTPPTKVLFEKYLNSDSTRRCHVGVHANPKSPK